MSTTQVRVVGTGLPFCVDLSGLWVSGSGRPYSTLPFTIHKLVGLAAGVLLAVIVYQTHQAASLGLLKIAAIVVTVLFLIGTVAAGALLSIDKPMPSVVLRLHQVLPVLTLLSTAGTLYLLLRGR
jgi:hypothetical protein